MRIEVSDPSLVDDLSAWLKRVRCRVVRVGDDTLEVDLPNPIPAGCDDTQLDLFLRVWEVRQDERATARRVEDDDDRSGIAGGFVRF